MFVVVVVVAIWISTEAVNQYNAECKKWGASADEDLLTRATACAELARATTLEGHYVRIFTTKKDKQERKDGLVKYATKYAAVDPQLVHAVLRAEVEKAMKKDK